MTESPPRAAAPKTSRLAPLVGAVTGRRSKWVALLVRIAIDAPLDAFTARSNLAPALTFDLGRVIQWPSRVSRNS